MDRITIRGGQPIEGIKLHRAGRFFLRRVLHCGGALVPSSRVVLSFTGVNPRRTALLDVLRRMGGRATIEALHHEELEPAGDIAASYSPLQAVELDDPAVVASMIDEIPDFRRRGDAGDRPLRDPRRRELRHKESDRIDAMTTNLRAMGARIEAFEDGFAIEGPTPVRGARVSSFGDHRIAMAMAVAALIAEGPPKSPTTPGRRISYPGFFRDLARLMR